MSDDLDNQLAPRPADPRDANHLAAIQRRTNRVIAFRTWMRRGKLVATGVVLLAGGAIGGWVSKPTPDPVREYVAVPVMIVLPPEPPTSTPTEEIVTAEQYELQAEQASAAEASRLYKLAGERFEKRYDFAQASRCYRLHLLAAPSERVVSASDSWLLISLKTTQSQETDRDPKQGS